MSLEFLLMYLLAGFISTQHLHVAFVSVYYTARETGFVLMLSTHKLLDKYDTSLLVSEQHGSRKPVVFQS